MLDDQDHATQPMKKLINETSTVFNNWISEWKLKTLKYTSVDLSLHSSTEGKPANFIMLSQKSINQRCRNKIMIHYKHIPHIVSEMQGFYVDLLMENDESVTEETTNPPTEKKKEKQILLYKENVSVIYSQLMHSAFKESSSKFCEGCELRYPSQKDHDCLMMPVDERVDLLFEFLFESIGGEDAHLFYV